ncbi:MAG: HD domain-containing protein [Clostridia bacterium]|nr:HD domain-containing protein [Clostridia bacterium]
MTLFEKAILFATDKHGGTKRKGEGTPYILHPLEVATIVATMTADEDVLAAAVLHDVAEDAGVTLGEIEREFGARTAGLVASETEDKRPGTDPRSSWLDRKKESLEVLKNTRDKDVKILWLGDKLANLRSFSRLKSAYGADMWKFFHQRDPKLHEWYYASIAEFTSELRDHSAWREYSRLLQEIFGD